MLTYQKLSFVDKLKFKSLSPHTVLTAVGDFLQDKKLTTVTIDRCYLYKDLEKYSETTCNVQVEILWNVFSSADCIEEKPMIAFTPSLKNCSFKNQKWVSYYLLNKCYQNRDKQFTYVPITKDQKWYVAIPNRQMTRVFDKFRWLLVHGVLQLGDMSITQLEKDIDFQFEVINQLNIEDYFYDRLHGLRDNHGYTKKYYKQQN